MIAHREDDLLINEPPFAIIVQKEGAQYTIAGKTQCGKKSEAVDVVLTELREHVESCKCDIAALMKYRSALENVEHLEQRK